MKELILERYWREQFKETISDLNLKQLFSFNEVGTHDRKTLHLELSEEIVSNIEALTNKSPVGRYIYMLTCLDISLRRFTQENKFAIATPEFLLKEEDKFSSDKLNFLRCEHHENKTIKEILNCNRERVIQAYKHQNFNNKDLLEKIKSTLDYNPNLLFQIGFYDDEIQKENEFFSECDIAISFSRKSEGGTIILNYKPGFNPLYIESFIQFFHTVLSKTLSNIDDTLNSLELYTEPVIDLGKLSSEKSFECKTIPELFETQAEKNPHKAALFYGDGYLSYHGLNEKVNQLAWYLIEEKNIQKGAIVGVCLESSVELLVSILAVMKTGGVVLPIAPTGPNNRTEYIIEDSAIKILIAHTSYEVKTSNINVPVCFIDKEWKHIQDFKKTNPKRDIQATALAYVIYTSGSTGKPKGACLSYVNLVNQFQWFKEYVNFQPNDVFPQKTTINFVDSIIELLFPITVGDSAVYLRPYDDIVLNQEELRAWLAAIQTSIVQFVPSVYLHFANSIDVETITTLRTLILSGEAFKYKRSSTQNFEVINLYGCSEGCAASTAYTLKSSDNIDNVPIGKPISNTEIYILNTDLQRLPIGAKGEIFIGGISLSNGYLNKEQLTKEKFIKNPFKENEKLYRTGDHGRWLPDGNIEYFGRTDNQVKIWGNRVEIGEIENSILNYKFVKDVAVISEENEQKENYLIAFIIGTASFEEQGVRSYLSNLLPGYMIPSKYIVKDSFPVTSSGKINRRTLKEEYNNKISKEKTYIAPRDVMENELFEIWQSLLRTNQFGVEDSFFELGGHSLLAAQMLSRIYKTFQVELTLKDIFEHSTIALLVKTIRTSEKTVYAKIQPTTKKEYYEVSNAQNRLWLLDQIEEGNKAYIMPVGYTINGLEKEPLENAFQELIKRHEILRSTIIMVDGKPMQKVQEITEFTFNIHHTDLSDSVDKDSELNKIFSDTGNEAFDMEKGPLLKVNLIQTETNQHVLLFFIHHIISDAWSMSIMMKELLVLYNAYKNDTTPSLHPLKIQYKDYAEWQNKQLKDNSLKEQQTYWLEKLNGKIAPLELPTDYIRPKFQTFNGAVLDFTLDATIKENLLELSKNEEVSFFMVLIASLKTVFYKYTGQTDIVIGTAAAGRKHPDLENQLGFYINTLALRTIFDAEDTFKEVLAKVKDTSLEAFDNQEYPFDKIIGELGIERKQGHAPLFDVMVTLQNAIQDTIDEELDGLTIDTYRFKSAYSKYDLSFDFLETAEGLDIYIEYNTDIFEASRIQQLFDNYKTCLESIIKNRNLKINEVEILSEKEKATLAGFNATEVALPESLSYLDHLDKIRQESPLKTAVVSGDVSVSYDDLWSRTNQLAHYLQTEHQIGKGSIVLVLLDRSLELMETILAIWKCGAAYIPLDPNFPISRIQEIVASSKSSLMVSLSGFTSGLTDICDFLHLDKEANNISNHSTAAVSLAFEPSDLAYVIYTSGSTGKPKGAMVEHIGMLNHLYSKVDVLELTQESIVSFNAPPIFDISVWQMFSGLLVGGSTVIYSQDLVLKPTAFMAQVKSDTISILEVVPSYLSLLLDTIEEGDTEAFFPALKYLMVTGETLKPVLARRWFSLFSEIPMVNAYGPTEASDDITHHVLDKAPELERVPIGKTVQNFHIHIVDESFNVCPIGVTGEIVVSGLGVGRGYLNDAERTDAVFIEDPFRKGVRMYRTGDLGRYLPNGDLDFLGRKDHQVKIRGHRIELGDIENHFVGLEGVKEAVVLDKEDNEGRKYLCAYLVLSEAVELDILKQKLGDRLPSYMLPSSYVLLDTMPLTSNGKLDRKTLLGYTEELQSNADTYVAARNEVEAALVSIWQEVLGKQQIGVMDNFFAVGGDSIKAVQVASRMGKAGYRLSVQNIMRYLVLSELAIHVKKSERSVDQSVISGMVPLNAIQEWFFESGHDSPWHYNQSMLLDFEQVVTPETIKAIFTTLQTHHDALRMVFREETGKWLQENKGLDHPLWLETYDLRGVIAWSSILSNKAAELQSSLRLETGPLMKLNLYHTDEGSKLLMVVHHLIMDGISWRILLEDLEDLYTQSKQGVTRLKLSDKTLSFKDWSVHMQEQSNSEAIQSEATYWQSILSSAGTTTIPRDLNGTDNQIQDTETFRATLNVSDTTLLQEQAHTAYNTEINDFLLTALGRSIHELWGKEEMLISLEGHGREELGDIDINRTIGWFTSEFPVLLKVSNEEDLLDTLIWTKEHLRKIPNKGIGYGLLAYVGEDKLVDRVRPQIGFNYLGDFDNDLSGKSFRVSSESIGMLSASTNQNDNELLINSMIVDGKLHIGMTYNTTHFMATTIENLVLRYKENLEALIAQCSKLNSTTLTPSDYSFNELSVDELENFFE
ncbi:non-ribosomal peptide synthetase [uncultured Kordia sp.]|uniref:non-ribosomal peptide synthetase n=1 Tax=uncultured Kordia sp. TaxID=507699 RepID=UPI002614B350|nr:non-ribosomal peptide synthetase [uncultured Kordia sp.]